MKKYFYIVLGFLLASAIGLFSINPTLAAQVGCALTIACDGGNNSYTGPGVQGDSTKGNGVVGNTRSLTGNVGVAGADLATTFANNYGVRGLSNLGTGVYGASTSSTTTHPGVRGFTAGSAPAVYGVSGGSASSIHTYGVYGYSPGTGVGGAGGTLGVQGTSSNGTGVVGTSSGGTGVSGNAININGVTNPGIGVSGLSGYIGVYGSAFWTGMAPSDTYGLYGAGTTAGTYSEGDSYGLYATTIRGNSDAVDGVYAYGDPTGVYAQGSNYGVTGYGSIVGVTGQNSSTSTGTAVLAQGNYPTGILYRGQSSAGSTAFTVDDSGNIYAKGQVSATKFVTHAAATVAQATSDGSRVTTFSAQQTAPSVEHVGEANLVGGTAIVRFDHSFASSMARGPYMVFLTPQGDTRGLYVAQKASSGFVVRETQGGRSTLAFDYRIVARPFSTTLGTEIRPFRAWPHGPAIQHRRTIRKPHILRPILPAMLKAPL